MSVFDDRPMAHSDDSITHSKNSDTLPNGPTRTGHTKTITIAKKLYIIKQSSESQIVAFSSSKYIIICKSHRMFLVVIGDARKRIEESAKWLNGLCVRLRESGH